MKPDTNGSEGCAGFNTGALRGEHNLHTLSSDTVYAVEASGRPLVAFQALSPFAVLEDTGFLEELRETVAQGRHVWDGKTPLQVRPATEPEIRTYHEWADEAFGFHLAYLMPLDDVPS